jgi:hypothetical protein
MSMGLMAFARCDAASCEEVAALAMSQASSHQVLQHIVHSGGSIADRKYLEHVRFLVHHGGGISLCISFAVVSAM